MPSLFIVGCGRNGTSMCAGLFRNSGLFMGDRLHAPGPPNPRGYFEDAAINALNNRILSQYVPREPVIYGGIEYLQDSPGARHGWLARIAVETEIAAPEAERAEIAAWAARAPFCFKDTRFCYLLHLWRAHAPDARMICIFRSPAAAARSILKNCQTHPGLERVAISVNQAFELWTLSYSHVLRRHVRDGQWLFVRYEDIFRSAALDAIEAFSGAPIDRMFPDAELNRSADDLTVPAAARSIHEELLARAADCYTPN